MLCYRPDGQRERKMKRNLIIDSKIIGQCESYCQLKELNAWVFTLDNEGYQILVTFDNIRHFTSCGDLEIVTYNF